MVGFLNGKLVGKDTSLFYGNPITAYFVAMNISVADMCLNINFHNMHSFHNFVSPHLNRINVDV